MRKHRLFGVLLLTSLIGCATAQQNRPSTTNIEKSSVVLISECLTNIKNRLAQIQDQHPQLAEIHTATVSLSSLQYTKGEVSWPEGESGGPHVNSADGCLLKVSLAHPHPQPQSGKRWVRGEYFPQVQLYVALVFESGGPDADAFRKIVNSIVREEVVWLVVRLDMAKRMKPNQAL
jgi:hypothetical protein